MKKRNSYIRKSRKIRRRATSQKGQFISPTLQRQADPTKEEEKDAVQKKSDGKSASQPTFIPSLSGNGHSLPAKQQHFFGIRMGHDFSDVRIHTGPDADQNARAVNALAYTVGKDVVFKQGKYNPETEEGSKLLAHELTHVVQQRNGRPKLQRADEKEISTPVPKDAKIDTKTGVATFGTTSADFIVEPDQFVEKAVTWHKQTILPAVNGAHTAFSIEYSNSYTSEGGKIKTVTTKYKVYIKTFYRKGVDKKATSKYGRGTTAEDIKLGTTSLKFHEGRHGQDVQDYIAKNALPALSLILPATKAEFDEAAKTHGQEVADYVAELQAYTEKTTDEVGTKKSSITTP